jgi:hypothetical protein
VRATPTGQLDQPMIALPKHPVDIDVIASAAINAHNRGTAFGRIQIEHALRLLQQLRQTAIELAFALVEAIHNDLIVISRQHTSQLATATVLAMGEVTFGATLTLSSGGHPRHINIEQQFFSRVIVLITARMFLQDSTDGLTHLSDVLYATSIECPADRRLVGAAITSESALDSFVRSHESIGFDDPLAAGQDVNQTVEQLLEWSMFVYLLFDLDPRANFRPDSHLLKAYSPRNKACTGREFDLLFVHCGSSQDFSDSLLKVSCLKPLKPS